MFLVGGGILSHGIHGVGHWFDRLGEHAAGAPGIGALLALAAVAGLAATLGRQLIARVPLAKVSYAGAVVFAALAIWTLVDLI